jgi:hypothetical protein
VAEKLNGPGFGFRMQAAGQQVSTADVARQVITRMSEAAIIRDHQLHALLAEWEARIEDTNYGSVGVEIYTEVSQQLRAVLGKQ